MQPNPNAPSQGAAGLPDPGEGRAKAPAPTTLTVVPLYETRMQYIDQSQYYGSDYFLKQIGFASNTPVPVLADSYTTTVLLTRAIQQAVGGLLTSRDGLSGAGLVKSLMDNAVKVSAGLKLEVGVEPSAQQLAQLDRDIVWYVAENVDGRQALVPKVYLADKTLQAYRQGSDASHAAAGASVAARGQVVIDATNVSNIDAQISAGAGVLSLIHI